MTGRPSRLRQRIRDDIARNRQRVHQLGPGLITGGAGDDPAGIATYTLVGATTGFSQLWLLLLSTPMMIANNPANMGRHTPTRFQNRFSMLALLVTSLLTVIFLWQWISP